MLALSSIPMFDQIDHPSVPTTFPLRKAAGGGQGWPKATAKRRVASLTATRGLATLATRARSVALPVPTISTASGNRKWEAHQKAGPQTHQLSCSCSSVTTVPGQNAASRTRRRSSSLNLRRSSGSVRTVAWVMERAYECSKGRLMSTNVTLGAAA
jgi:hypothetical protein